MKKLLIGLVALAGVSYAVAPDLGAGAVADTNMIEIGQRGMINLKTTITSVPYEDVKYVIFTSTGDGNSIDGASDFVQLPEFGVQIQSNGEVASTIAGFLSAPSIKVYIKRVVDGQLANLDTADVPGIKIRRGYTDLYHNLTTAESNGVNAQGNNFLPTWFLSESTINSLASAVGGTRPSSTGSAVLGPNGLGFKVKGILVQSPEKGVITFTDGPETVTTSDGTGSPETDTGAIQKWNAFFQKSVKFSADACIKVQML